MRERAIGAVGRAVARARMSRRRYELHDDAEDAVGAQEGNDNRAAAGERALLPTDLGVDQSGQAEAAEDAAEALEQRGEDAQV